MNFKIGGLILTHNGGNPITSAFSDSFINKYYPSNELKKDDLELTLTNLEHLSNKEEVINNLLNNYFIHEEECEGLIDKLDEYKEVIKELTNNSHKIEINTVLISGLTSLFNMFLKEKLKLKLNNIIYLRDNGKTLNGTALNITEVLDYNLIHFIDVNTREGDILNIKPSNELINEIKKQSDSIQSKIRSIKNLKEVKADKELLSANGLIELLDHSYKHPINIEDIIPINDDNTTIKITESFYNALQKAVKENNLGLKNNQEGISVKKDTWTSWGDGEDDGVIGLKAPNIHETLMNEINHITKIIINENGKNKSYSRKQGFNHILNKALEGELKSDEINYKDIKLVFYYNKINSIIEDGSEKEKINDYFELMNHFRDTQLLFLDKDVKNNNDYFLTAKLSNKDEDYIFFEYNSKVNESLNRIGFLLKASKSSKGLKSYEIITNLMPKIKSLSNKIIKSNAEGNNKELIDSIISGKLNRLVNELK